MPSELPQAPYREPLRAHDNWSRLAPRLPGALRQPLASLLAQSPDPDGALDLLERFAREAGPEVLRELAARPAALTYLIAAFGFGGLLAEAFLAEPGLALQFARDRQFAALRSRDDLREDFARSSTTPAPEAFTARLVRFKRRNYVRIALKDVLGLATLAQTTLELSALADVILAEALHDSERELQARFGQPQYRDAQGRVARSGFSVVSLGKLGGSELNYSSDIDLLFLYARDGETAGGGGPQSAVSNKEYFVRLAQALTSRLTMATAEGAVFRVDLRLRPDGDQGDLALSLGAALDYYSRRAQDWELQMLIKARHSAGDARLTRAFLAGVEARIYEPSSKLAAVDSVLISRERISRRLRASRREAIDVKRQPGGIRDVEFLTQCLQRLHGAREPWVRSGGTLHALRNLNDKGLLSDADYAALTSAYEFLRTVEHRIQLERGQQSHRLPADEGALERLARRAGLAPGGGLDAGSALTLEVNRMFGEVEKIHRRLLHPGAAGQGAGAFELTPLDAGLNAYPPAHSAIMRLLGARAPALGRLVSEAAASPRGRPRVARFMTALAESAEALELALAWPLALERALGVLRVSEPLGDLLIRHPQDLAVLAERAPTAVPEGQMKMPLEWQSESVPRCGDVPAFAWVAEPSLDVRAKMSLLRWSFRARALELGAGDCERMDSVYATLRRWSALAAACVSTAFAIAGESLGASVLESGLRLAVLGLGRLGLNEFDLGSDADVIFVAAPQTNSAQMALAVKLAEKTLEVLSSYTRDGVVFAVDTRLRPRGAEGELVVSEDALLHYVLKEAQPWEALTYLKACAMAGDGGLGLGLSGRLAEAAFARFADDPLLAGALRDMRRRLEREPKAGQFSTKSAPGGYYDVDFAVSYLRLRHRVSLPAGSNMVEQVEALARSRLLAGGDAQALAEGAGFLRALDHAMRLVTGKRLRGLPERQGSAQAIEHLLRLWRVAANASAVESVAEQLARVQQQVRSVFDRVLGTQ